MIAAPAGASPTIGRQERFASVGSTNDVVRDWLAAGEPEICVAVADEQTAGRGRNGRTWTAPPGAAVLASFGFRPGWLHPEHIWRLAASVSLAMAEEAEIEAALPSGTIRLKWPNDLVALVDRSRAGGPPSILKLGGVLGEAAGLGMEDPTVIVGIGFNASWPPGQFPPDLRPTMSSLRELAPDRQIDDRRLFSALVAAVDARVRRLRAGTFDVEEWRSRQITTGRLVTLETGSGSDVVRAAGVDAETGALLVGDPGDERSVFVGDIRHVRLVEV